MRRIPRISEAEWEVMKVVWKQAPCTANTIITALETTDNSWHPKTVKTLLTRLVQKRALGFKKDGRAYVYRPIVQEKECVDVVSRSFLERVFGGSLRPMLAHFVERQKLSLDEIQELRRLLDERED